MSRKHIFSPEAVHAFRRQLLWVWDFMIQSSTTNKKLLFDHFLIVNKIWCEKIFSSNLWTSYLHLSTFEWLKTFWLTNRKYFWVVAFLSQYLKMFSILSRSCSGFEVEKLVTSEHFLFTQYCEENFYFLKPLKWVI